MKHADLVKVGEGWMRKTVGCSVVATELRCYSGQEPDVIGFRADTSFLIEVKVSVADFRRDGKKPHQREEEKSVGNYRWILTPPGLLSADKLPNGWGLLEAHGDKVRVIKGSLKRGVPSWDNAANTLILPAPPKAGHAHRFDNVNIKSERAMLFSIARRLSEQASPNRTKE